MTMHFLFTNVPFPELGIASLSPSKDKTAETRLSPSHRSLGWALSAGEARSVCQNSSRGLMKPLNELTGSLWARTLLHAQFGVCLKSSVAHERWRVPTEETQFLKTSLKPSLNWSPLGLVVWSRSHAYPKSVGQWALSGNGATCQCVEDDTHHCATPHVVQCASPRCFQCFNFVSGADSTRVTQR